MSVNDITMFEPGQFGTIGSKKYYVAAGATAINFGEPVVLSAMGAGATASAMATSKPVVLTDYVVGIAASASTQTATVGGVVDVFPLVRGAMYKIAPNVAATFGLASTPVQATYTALVGSRVTMDLTGGKYTLNSTDGPTYGCIVEYQDVKQANGKVLFSFRGSATYTDY